MKLILKIKISITEFLYDIGYYNLTDRNVLLKYYKSKIEELKWSFKKQ